MPRSTREQRGWYLYDWANSAFATTVVTLFLGPYLTSLAKAGAGGDGLLHILGLPIDPRSYWSYMVGLSVGAQVMFLPVIGAIVDYGRRKKEVPGVGRVPGRGRHDGDVLSSRRPVSAGRRAVSDRERELWRVRGDLQFVSSRDCPAPGSRCGIVQRVGDRVPGRRLAAGAEPGAVFESRKIGISEGMAVRISLCSAGVWWAAFSIPTLLALHNRGPARSLPPGQNGPGDRSAQLRHTARNMRQYPQTLEIPDRLSAV